MSKLQKILASTVVVGVLGSLVALGVFGAFSATTQNAGNEISAGTVVLSDNDAGSAMFNITNAKPGETWTRCIKILYSGSLPATIHMYELGGQGPLSPYLNLKLEQGTQAESTFPSCTGFTPDGTNGTGVDYEGTAFGWVGTTYETGAPIVPFGKTAWEPGDSLIFKATLTLKPEAPELAQGNTTGQFTIVAEARNNS
ncbi:MAG: TasA family protein [Solirubrobacterales bacterium]